MADEEPLAEEPTKPARPKKKKKKKPAVANDAAPAATKSKKKKDEEPEPLPGVGTAHGDKLRAAVRAFEVGDYVRVRALTDELGKCDEPEIRKAALALRSRIGIDPVQIVVIAACALVLLVIVYVWVL